MLEYYHQFNNFILSFGLPWWIWAVVGLLLSLAFIDGFQKGIGILSFLAVLLFSFLCLPIYFAEKFESGFGYLFGLILGVLFLIGIGAWADKIQSMKGRFH